MNDDPHLDPGPRRGRGRPRTETTGSRRQAIVDAAAAEFSATGFSRTSLRQIARTAGVDAALVHHYFGSKEELFLAATEFPVNPLEILSQHLPAVEDVDSFGTALLEVVVPIWDQPEVSARIAAVVRSLDDDPAFARMLVEFMRDRLFATVLGRFPHEPSPAEREVAFTRFITLMIGIITGRYVARIKALSDLDAPTIAALFGPMLDTALGSASES